MIKAELARLRNSFHKALEIDEKELAMQIKATGFLCRKCAQCCRAEFGDNTVTVFPSEINCIRETTGLFRDDFVIPTPSVDKDAKGNIHTFEWVLRKNGDCIFLENDLCEIYECRPHICRTYPFFLLDGKLEVSECIGLGGNINDEESLMLAVLLKQRYIKEIMESIALLERFNGFIPGSSGNVCVHDSEGEHWLMIKDHTNLE
ncbi:MAG: YkgJ family cysteine cluster protein [Candidatus Methanoperedens sp.]|nr:YkgJ family cysteine cluster protein [Candidatus Methanoperedens sp.]